MHKITVITFVQAPLEKVWEFWTQPEHIIGWSFASDDWEAANPTNDLRVGGVFSTIFRAKDGSAEFNFSGQYTEVEKEKVLAYKLGDDRKVRITFTNTENGVEIVEEFDSENENPLDMQRNGWQAILDNFKKYTEAQ